MWTRTARVFALAGGALAFGLFMAGPAAAQRTPPKEKTPENWSYEIKDGKRVPRGNRVTSPDGSWREERRDGNCVTVRQQSADGEYRETRKCD